MNCFTVTVQKGEEKILFHRMWGETKVDACMEALVAVKNFYTLDMEAFAELRATARVNRDVMKGELL
jgi:hypothetical protein